MERLSGLSLECALVHRLAGVGSVVAAGWVAGGWVEAG